MKFEIDEKQFVTIRQAARALGLSHDRIRLWQKQGLVAGFYSGTRFYVNLPAFRAALEAGQIGARPQVGGRFCGGDPAEEKAESSGGAASERG